MKKTMKNLLSIILVALLLVSCKKEELNPVAKPESGVYGQGTLKSGSFVSENDAASVVNMQLKWIDVNRVLTINKQELFITLKEAYVDKNGNPATANHGTKSLKVMDAKGNNEASTFSVSADDVYKLFATSKFDYGKGSVDVFGDARPAGKRFNKNNSFVLSWAFTSTEGLVYKWWSVSIVNIELYSGQPAIQANASVTWSVK
jgi:hypothetical protein